MKSHDEPATASGDKPSATTKEAPSTHLKSHIDGTGGTWSACVNDNPPAPTDYTGLIDPSTADPGFGIYANTNYDNGWRAGYQDAMFYYNYYGGAGPSCSYDLKIRVFNTTTFTYSLQPITYVLQANEQEDGAVMDGSCSLNDWPLLKCLLHNELSAKSYRLQLQFNNQYTGTRTQAQKDYDSGIYTAFVHAIETAPFSDTP